MGLFVKSLQAAFFQPFTRIVRALFKMANMWLFSLIELKHYLVMNTQIHLDICKTAVFIWAQWLLGQFIKIEHKYKSYFVRLHEKQRCWRCLFRILWLFCHLVFEPRTCWNSGDCWGQQGALWSFFWSLICRFSISSWIMESGWASVVSRIQV